MDVENQLHRALALRDRGDSSGALRAIDEILADCPENLDALRIRGGLLVTLERHAEASENQARLESLAAPSILGLLRQGHTLQALQQICERGPDHPLAQEAIKHLERALDEDGLDDPGTINPPKSNPERLIQILRRLQQRSPHDLELRMLLGDLYFSLHLDKQSELEYRLVLRHDLHHRPALIALVKVCQRMGQIRDASLAYKKLLELDPSYPGLPERPVGYPQSARPRLMEFEDLNHIDDDSLLKVLRLVDARDIALALKGANSDLAERVHLCLPFEIFQTVIYEGQALGQVTWDELTGAQQQIRKIMRGLVSLGKITLPPT